MSSQEVASSRVICFRNDPALLGARLITLWMACSSGQFRGHIRGTISGHIRGQCRGHIRGTICGPISCKISINIRGQIKSQIIGQRINKNHTFSFSFYSINRICLHILFSTKCTHTQT